MVYLIWYVIIGLIAGLFAKSVMYLHLTLLWTVVLGIVGSLIGGFGTHLFIHRQGGSLFYPAGIIFSILGALFVFFLRNKQHLPA